MIQKSYEKNNLGILYIIPTPIGNIDDITFRAINILKEVDYILVEDTRETIKLLNNYKINKSMISCHKYNENKIKDKILNILMNNKNIALVTDRGTPLISDPGYIIVKYCIENGINVVALPGPCAFLPALNMSSIECSKFLFFGFLNKKDSEAKKELLSLKDLKYPIILYESPFRVERTLLNIKNIYGERNISICREITKLHEEIFRGTVSEAINTYNSIKGEIVIIIENDKNVHIINSLEMEKEVEDLLKQKYSFKDAVNIVSKKYNISKNLLYNKIERK